MNLCLISVYVMCVVVWYHGAKIIGYFRNGNILLNFEKLF